MLFRTSFLGLLLFITSAFSSAAQNLSNHYSPQFLRILQIVFGTEDLISQGGYDSLEKIFASIDLKHKKVLDIGSGFGGAEIYLAKKFDVEIVGVDMEPYMIAAAQTFLEKNRSLLKGTVSFQTLENAFRLDEFEDETFDLIFSKECFYNVPRDMKQAYLTEIYRTLKPGGKIVFSDWMQSAPIAGAALKKASKNEKICQFVTPEAFCRMLEIARFKEIRYENHTESYIRYTIEDCSRLDRNSALIIDEFGESTYLYRVEAWKNWLDAQVAGDLIAGYFWAEKP